VMMRGVGHLPYEEVPEEFNRVLLEFLHPPTGD
jgi:pimeloyl-ACP methyl ester carboxylesterase